LKCCLKQFSIRFEQFKIVDGIQWNVERLRFKPGTKSDIKMT
jgi:hypothetical protein